MPTVQSDWLGGGTLQATEDQGAISSVTRTFLVTDCVSTNYAILAEALNATGIPDYNDPYPTNNNLIVVRKSARVLDDANNRKAVVEVEYTTLGMEDGNFRFSFTSSMSEEQTSNDVNGNLITLAYSYPVDYANPQYADTTSTQAAELTVYRPELTATTTGILSTGAPVAVISGWLGYLNSDAWQGSQAGTWLCTRCDAVPHDLDASPPKYKFTFEFQLKRNGWTQTAYFRTDDTGKIPGDLVFGTGYKRVVTNPYRQFGEVFPDS